MGFLRMKNKDLPGVSLMIHCCLHNPILYSLCTKKAPAMTNTGFPIIDLRAGFKLI